MMKYIRHIFKSDSGSVGTFVLPFFSLSYILSVFGFIVMFYVGYEFFNSLWASFVYGFNFFRIGNIYLLPDSFIFLSVFTLIFSMILISVYFTTAKRIVPLKKNILDISIYSFVYFALFPFNLLHSFVKFMSGRYQW